MKYALPVLLAALALPAAAQQRLPGAEQQVTAPAPFGQSNKESVVLPGDTLNQASCGRVLQGEPAGRAQRASAPSARAYAPADPGIPGVAAYVPPPPSAVAAGPMGPPLVESAYLTLRGTLASFDKGLGVTIVDRNGRSRTVPLARGARLDDGLRAGDLVAVRIPLEDDPANKLASRVERQKPAAPAPMSSRSSKFAQAQAAAN